MTRVIGKRGIIFIVVLMAAAYLAARSYGITSGTGVSLQVNDSVNLELPFNNSGMMFRESLFFYNVADVNDVENCSLIINNKVNITRKKIIKNMGQMFRINNTPVSTFNWSINCTDSAGFTTQSETRRFFAHRMTKFNGSTTNLSKFDITSFDVFRLETLPHGRIHFDHNMQFSRGMDFDRFVNISDNRIEIKSDFLRELNKSATLTLTGLTFSDPRIVRDGFVCPDSICSISSYSGGTLTFTASYFSVYEAEETPSDDSGSGGGTSGGGGGGGGGGGAPGQAEIPLLKNITVKDFEVSRENLKVILKQGETKEEKVILRNTGNVDLSIKSNIANLREFLISPTSNLLNIKLEPDETEEIFFVFRAQKEQEPNVYPRKIEFREDGIEKTLNTVLEIESAKPLFDVDVEVLPEFKTLAPGDGILVEVFLINVRGFGRVDVFLEYSILDFDGNVLAREEETVAVEKQARFNRELHLPEDVEPGTYVASVKVTFEDSIGISSDLFEVKAKTIRLGPVQFKDFSQLLVPGIVLVVIASMLLGYNFFKRLGEGKEEETRIVKKEQINELRKKLKALEKGYNTKLISKESFERQKEKIEKELKKLGKGM